MQRYRDRNEIALAVTSAFYRWQGGRVVPRDAERAFSLAYRERNTLAGASNRRAG